MNKHYKTLELHKITDMLAEQAGNEETRRMIGSLEPVSDIEKVKTELKKTEDAFELAVKFGTPPFYKFKDIRGSLQRAQSGSSLTLRELLDIGVMLRQIQGLSDYHASCGENVTVLDPLFEELSPNKWLEDKIKNAILSEEEIADTASAELANIRRKIAQAGIRIRESLDKMIRSADVQKSLMDNIVTVRDGRYVLPVKAEHKGNVRGIVHASSATGSTLFIEPEAVVEANNDIRVLQGREQEEIERIIA
ncbi:MAG: endonuclease MutS2, partial [Oscillospiraceae bacterium]|nr:endonuclease MutS2 [Oscillospiraceae bacterium]